MSTKTVELEEDVLEFARQRCEADIELGMRTIARISERRGQDVRAVQDGKKVMDYVIMARRLKGALDKAR